MAVGDVTQIGEVDGEGAAAIELLATTTSTNGVPSGSSAGLAVSAIMRAIGAFRERPDTLSLVVYSTAGSGTMSATCRLWFYDPVSADWFPAGTGDDTTKGVIDAGTALGETSADKIRHTEPVYFPGHATRVYLEVTAISGTGTALKSHLVARRPAD